MRVLLAALLCFGLAAPPAAAQTGLHAQPTLVLDPGFHTAAIVRADAAAGFAVTASHDKTVRVFAVEDGRHLRTIRLPAGPGNVGKAYAVAISPDGDIVAAGGWTRWTEADPQEQIYLFDRESGELVHRIDGLPNVVNHLAFSPASDGRFLAAALAGGHGLRVFDQERGWAEVARDPDYLDGSYGVAFAPGAAARLASTSLDGRIRLYKPLAELAADGHIAPEAAVAAPAGSRPFGLAFRPEGAVLAVGYQDTTAVSLLGARSLDAPTLATLDAPDTGGLDGGNLASVAWSADGAVLFAGGRRQSDGYRLRAWADGGAGARRSLEASASTIMSLVPLPAGDLLVAAQDPYLARLAPFDDEGGTPVWPDGRHGPLQADLRDQHKTLSVSADGGVVDFGYEQWGEVPARFDVAALDLRLDPPADDRTATPLQDTLPVANWVTIDRPAQPTLDGAPLPLQPHEMSRSLAVHPAGDRFVLGTDWSLRAFDATGAPLWGRPVPGVAWAVNVTGDGRLVVAAYADGTIRWHRMDDGRELLAFFALEDRENWVAWTPEGVYAATEGARDVLRWHVNRGWDAPGEAIPVHEIPETHRPRVIRRVLDEMGTGEAIAAVELEDIRSAIQRRTGSSVAPGARLHVLAIGVSDYGEAATELRLNFAHQDADDVATTLVRGNSAMYAEVVPDLLQDAHADEAGILDALDALEAKMSSGGDEDLAVVFFAGHGAEIDGRHYLLPHGVDARSSKGRLRAGAMAIDDLAAEIAQVARHGRVLVLLDACRSGAATAAGDALAPDPDALRRGLEGVNVTVLTSSNAETVSYEHERWQNGAFTEGLLRALERGDENGNGRVEVRELMGFLQDDVPRMTRRVLGHAQRPDIAVRFDGDVFVAGLR